MHARREGVELTFAEKLDPTTAQDPASYAVQRWAYRWTENYGSKHYRISNPAKEGHDEMNVLESKLLNDGKTILLKLEDLRPVMQMQIDIDIKSADGAPIK